MGKIEISEYLSKDIESLRSMNFAETYIKASVENTAKWASTGLLEGIQDTYVGRQVALLMENQRLLNEQWPGGISLVPENAEPDVPLETWMAQWRRMSIPVIRRVFAPLIGNQLVSVQTMKNAQENTYLTGFDGKTVAGMTEANTRKLETRWLPSQSEDGRLNLEAESDACATFSRKVQEEFSREIIRDLTLHAGTKYKAEYKDEKGLLDLIEGMSAYIAAKTFGRDANWIVLSPMVASILKEHIQAVEPQEGTLKHIGTLSEKWKVFEDSQIASGNILMGHKNNINPMTAGYIFAPYLPFNPVPSWHTEKEKSEGYVLAKYGKRLVNPGFYGLLTIKGLPDAIQEC